MPYLEAIQMNASYFGWGFVLASAVIGFVIYLFFSEILGALNCSNSVCLSLSLLAGMAATISLYQLILFPEISDYDDRPVEFADQHSKTLPPDIEKWLKNPCETECYNPHHL